MAATKGKPKYHVGQVVWFVDACAYLQITRKFWHGFDNSWHYDLVNLQTRASHDVDESDVRPLTAREKGEASR